MQQTDLSLLCAITPHRKAHEVIANGCTGSGSSVESADQITGRSSSSASLSNSFVVVPDMGAGPPLLKFKFVSQMNPPESPKHAAVTGEAIVLNHPVELYQTSAHGWF